MTQFKFKEEFEKLCNIERYSYIVFNNDVVMSLDTEYFLYYFLPMEKDMYIMYFKWWNAQFID